MNQKGLIPILIVLIIAALVGGYLIYQKQTKSTSTPSSQQTIQISPSPVDSTANWKTYTNTKYNFQLKYPLDWNVESIPSINSPNNELGESDYLRFYNEAKNLENKKFVEECTKNPTLTKCGTERYANGIFVNIHENKDKTNFETYFQKDLAKNLTITGDINEIISKSKKDQIGSLNIIKGNKVDVTGWPYYYFQNPSGNIAFIIDGSESEKTVYQILSTFKFLL